jgi:DNA-directed RNA polymerase subunit RPC12/RpoP/predicted RNase H-like HicB family nuclease
MDAKGIARALRTQLKEINVTLTHAQSLELVAKTAGVKDWNVLCARQAPCAETGTGLFCPHCGARGTVFVKADATIEQGPWDGKSFVYEGDAPHYVCNTCGGQFLNWESDWPNVLEHTETLMLLRHCKDARFRAYWVRVNVLLAARGDSLEELLADIDEAYKERGEHGHVVYHLEELAEANTKGSTEREAMRELWKKIPEGDRDSVVNREYLQRLGLIV